MSHNICSIQNSQKAEMKSDKTKFLWDLNLKNETYTMVKQSLISELNLEMTRSIWALWEAEMLESIT